MKKTKYKKVFSMTGELCLRNYTVKDIIDLKSDRQLTQTLPFTSNEACLLYTSPSPRDLSTSRMPSSA